MKNSVKAERTKCKLTQVKLAAKIGVSRQTIHAIEKGRKHPSVLLALKIAFVLNATVDKLFQLQPSDVVEKGK